MWLFVLLMVLGFLVVHLAKMCRLYLVLMEHKIPFGKFLLLYFKTTFINLIIPFKLGELYRFYCIKRETKVWQVGILSVVIDRFFDIAALFVVLFPFDILVNRRFTMITVVFLVVILLCAGIYVSILPTYTYLNQYIITKKSSKRAMTVLKGLDVIKDWYEFMRNLIAGRFALILATSFVGWVCEVGVLKLLADFLKISFGAGDFSGYISNIFLGGENEVANTYTLYSAVIFLALAVLAQIIYWVRMAGRKKKIEGYDE